MQCLYHLHYHWTFLKLSVNLNLLASSASCSSLKTEMSNFGIRTIDWLISEPSMWPDLVSLISCTVVRQKLHGLKNHRNLIQFYEIRPVTEHLVFNPPLLLTFEDTHCLLNVSEPLCCKLAKEHRWSIFYLLSCWSVNILLHYLPVNQVNDFQLNFLCVENVNVFLVLLFTMYLMVLWNLL